MYFILLNQFYFWLAYVYVSGYSTENHCSTVNKLLCVVISSLFRTLTEKNQVIYQDKNLYSKLVNYILCVHIQESFYPAAQCICREKGTKHLFVLDAQAERTSSIATESYTTTTLPAVNGSTSSQKRKFTVMGCWWCIQIEKNMTQRE